MADGFPASSSEDKRLARLERLNAALAEQKAFIHRVPDPDTRERAEANLIILVQMRDAIIGRS